MKILKPGKVEQRKFTCPDCGCEFVVGEMEREYLYAVEVGIIFCPTCSQNIPWDSGEPYEEPTTTQTDRERLMALVHDAPQKHANSWPEAAEIIADYLAHGVTFREG